MWWGSPVVMEHGRDEKSDKTAEKKRGPPEPPPPVIDTDDPLGAPGRLMDADSDKAKEAASRRGCLAEGCPWRQYVESRGPAEEGARCECGHPLAMHIVTA